jgi:formylglycine-generating enzyme required for sulfatase activity
MQFCRWLRERTGRNVSLPTEAQWEWACRAGTETPLYHGGIDDDFSGFANLADRASQGSKANPFPRITSVNDSLRFSDARGVLQPNAWGLYDMHGNVAEWTRSMYRPYPYHAADGRNDVAGAEQRVVRGGSWRDRPSRATSSYRLAYRPYQKVLNVGFRIAIEE